MIGSVLNVKEHKLKCLLVQQFPIFRSVFFYPKVSCGETYTLCFDLWFFYDEMAW